METINKPTRKQLWTLFCMTGWDFRQSNISFDDAFKLIGHIKEGKVFEPEKFEGIIQVKQTVKKVSSEQNFEAIYREAVLAGKFAMKEKIPTPMIVQEHSSPIDDNSPVKRQYYCGGGVCGFAWVKVIPATQPFARWLKKQKIVDSVSYTGGYDIWVHEGGQLMELKEAYAQAFSEVLRKHGIDVYAQSRMD